jgi:Bacterial membrane protein YfhO
MVAKKKKVQKTKEQAPQTGKFPDLSLPAWLEKPWRFELALAVFLLIVLGFFFREFITTSGGMIWGGDMQTQAYQTRMFGVETFKETGSYPLWNPDSYCGMPYLGALPGPIYFPTSLLYYIMPLERAIGYSYLLMMVAGGLFMFFWIRELGLARVAGAVCAVAYGFTGWMASTLYAGHDGRGFTIMLLPLVFFFLERALRRRKLVYFLLMGLAVALQILSPHVQMMYFSSLAAAAYFVFRIVVLYREKVRLLTLAVLGGGFAAGFLLAVALSAVQFWPSVVNQEISHRQEKGYAHATQYSMYPLDLGSLVVPGFIGEPYNYWGPGGGEKGHSEYMGLLPLVLAALALAYRRNKMTWFFTGLGLAAVLYNFGGHTPFFKLPYYLLPKVKDFRGPDMMFFVASFSTITLAGYGLDYLLTGGSDKGDRSDDRGLVLDRGLKVLVASVGVMLLILLVLGAGKSAMPGFFTSLLPDGVGQTKLQALQEYYPKIIASAGVSFILAALVLGLFLLWRKGVLPLAFFAVALMLIVFGDLMRMNHNWLRVQKKEVVYAEDNFVKFLDQQKEPYRVFLYPTQRTMDFWDNRLLYFRVPTINASMPLRLSWYEKMMGTHMFFNFRNIAIDKNTGSGSFRGVSDKFALWNMLNVRFVTIRNTEFTKAFEQLFPFLERKGGYEITDIVPTMTASRAIKNMPRPKPMILYENPQVWERFRLFSRFETLDDDDKFLLRLEEPDFDAEQTLVLMEEPGFDTELLDGTQPEGEVKLESYGNEVLELTVRTERPALLYLAETYHPFWEVTVDGEPAHVYRANLAMRAVFVQAGEHKIVMRYHSPPYERGKMISLLSLLLLAAAVGWTAYRRQW